MLFHQVLVFLVAVAMASSSAPKPDADSQTIARQEHKSSRDIMMYTDHTKQETRVKFRNVSAEYSIEDMKHADHAGMFWVFKNGEKWLTLKDKRLFLLPDYAALDTPPGPEAPEDCLSWALRS
jgi:hypothetical protein